MIKQAHIKPSYANAKKRSKEEVKVLTDAYIMNNELSKIGINKKYHLKICHLQKLIIWKTLILSY